MHFDWLSINSECTSWKFYGANKELDKNQRRATNGWYAREWQVIRRRVVNHVARYAHQCVQLPVSVNFCGTFLLSLDVFGASNNRACIRQTSDTDRWSPLVSRCEWVRFVIGSSLRGTLTRIVTCLNSYFKILGWRATWSLETLENMVQRWLVCNILSLVPTAVARKAIIWWVVWSRCRRPPRDA